MSSFASSRTDGEGPIVQVKRHRTAITRQEFSRPLKALLAHKLIDQNTLFLDYGCGLGDDVRNLRQLGFKAAGWDPVYFPSDPLEEADVVNLGYVLNVIENVNEREQTLTKAYALARRLLSVAVIVGASDYEGRSIPYEDGVLTSKSTFQKYFEQEELAALIQRRLGVSALAVAPGIFFVFRDIAQQNAFLIKRLQRSEIPTVRGLPRSSRPSIQSALTLEFKKCEEELWKEYVEFVRENGRPPTDEESLAHSGARTYSVHENDLFKAARDELGAENIERVAEARRNELLVFLAISHFRRLPKLKELPSIMRQSVRFHFGSFENALTASKDRLLLAGNQAEIKRLAGTQSFGLNTFDGYFVAARMIDRLPPTLQILARISELFYGDLSSVDMVKIHKNSPKITLLIFDGFDSAERPTLKTRVKIDLKEQKIRVFDHSDSDNPELLVGKDLVFDIQNVQKDNKESRITKRLLDLRLPFGTVAKASIVAKIEQDL